MRQSNQNQNYKSKVVPTPVQRVNYRVQTSQQNVYQSQFNQPSSSQNTQGSNYYISGRAPQQSTSNRNVYSSNNEEQEKPKNYIAQRGNQNYSSQNQYSQAGQRIEKKIYGNQPQEDNNRIKKIPIQNNNNINERNKQSSLLLSADNYPREANISGKFDRNNNESNSRNAVKFRENPKEKKIEVRQNRMMRKTNGRRNDKNNRAKSQMRERRNIDLSPPKSFEKKGVKASSADVKRKEIVRGGKYKNIKITHIYYSNKQNLEKYNFHIFEELSTPDLEKLLNLNKNRQKHSINGKSEFKSSCEGRIFSPKTRGKIQKTTVFQHAGGMGMTNLEPDKINSSFYTSGLRDIPQVKKEKAQPTIQVVKVFRSQNPDQSSSIFSNNRQNNDNYNNNARMNKSTTSNVFNARVNKPNQLILNNTVNKPVIDDNDNSNNNVQKSILDNYYSNLSPNHNARNRIEYINSSGNKCSISPSYNTNQLSQTNYKKDSMNSSSNTNQARSYKININRAVDTNTINPSPNRQNQSPYNTNNSKYNNRVILTEQSEDLSNSGIYTQNEPKEISKDNNRPIQNTKFSPNNYYNKNLNINTDNKYIPRTNKSPSSSYNQSKNQKPRDQIINLPKKFMVKPQSEIFNRNYHTQTPNPNENNKYNNVSTEPSAYTRKDFKGISASNPSLNTNYKMSHNTYNSNNVISSQNLNPSTDFNRTAYNSNFRPTPKIDDKNNINNNNYLSYNRNIKKTTPQKDRDSYNGEIKRTPQRETEIDYNNQQNIYNSNVRKTPQRETDEIRQQNLYNINIENTPKNQVGDINNNQRYYHKKKSPPKTDANVRYNINQSIQNRVNRVSPQNIQINLNNRDNYNSNDNNRNAKISSSNVDINSKNNNTIRRTSSIKNRT